jgi:FkbM family methyltransferase
LADITLEGLRRRTAEMNQQPRRAAEWFNLNATPAQMIEAVKRRSNGLPTERPVHEPEFMFFHNFDGDSGLFADIGANTGQSAISFRNVNQSMRIISFEINPLLDPMLQLLKDEIADYECRNIGLSDRDSAAHLYLPVWDTHIRTPLASLRRDVFEKKGRLARWKKLTGLDAIELLILPVTLRRFDELDLAPTIVKIDVEGANFPVLSGMVATLERHRPIVMCEVEGERKYIELLGRLGYLHFVYSIEGNSLRPVGGGPEGAINTLFIHASKLDDVRRKGVATIAADG